MKYRRIIKNISSIKEGLIVHGVNCQGKMGAGAAKVLRAKHPSIFTPYSRMVEAAKAGGNLEELLGQVLVVPINQSLYVGHGFTQLYYGRDEGRKYASLDAVRTVLSTSVDIARSLNLPLYTTMLGCNLGGLNWNTEVAPLVDALPEIDGFEITVCQWNGARQ